MYDHTKQYRCEIIRGKSQKEMDDLLPVYAKVIDEICPCSQSDFVSSFNKAFSRYIPEADRTNKTFNNHRTEISGKLFGMYYYSDDGMVYESERTQKYIADNDQPAFFKDLCYKMQFPNGMQKTKPTVIKRIEDGICIRPTAFLLKLLLVAKSARIDITKKMIGYYVLNSKDVLQGKSNPYEVLDAIRKDKKSGISRIISSTCETGEPRAASYNYQHINEQINYLELANLIRIVDNENDHNDKRVIINPREIQLIELIAEDWDKKPAFDVSSYDLSTAEKRKKFQLDWDFYHSRLAPIASSFTTSAESLAYNGEDIPLLDREEDIHEIHTSINPVEIGDEGEELVYQYEKTRVTAYSARLGNKVLSLGKTKGLGYDIQSVVAEPGEFEEFVKYIEVKSTKRLTAPDLKDELWIDTLNITRNEYIAANQHGPYYSIYRVYFSKDGVSVFVISDVKSKIDDGKIQVTPMTYRMDFSTTAIDNSFLIKDCTGVN